MTERLYLSDSYLQEFDTEIANISDNSATLNKTIFYPESGGQPGDRGTISTTDNTYTVKATKLSKGKILHELDSIQGLNIGTKIHGKIDWTPRFAFMKSHTAQHVISRYFQINYGAETISTQIKQNSSRLDFHPMNKLPDSELEHANNEINKIISRNIPVLITFLPRKEAISFLQAKEYQTKYLEMVPKSVMNFRIIEIKNYDWAACGGTHVKNTSELGSVKFIEMKNKGKNKERLVYTFG